MNIYLIDGTYELFRNHFGAPARKAPDGREVGATVGLIRSLYALLSAPRISYVAVAFDHVIESFRNDLYPGYKSSAGVDPDLLAQFRLAEEAVAALGLTVWPMVEFEADDALASATARLKKLSSVEQIVLASPDKDLAQLVLGRRIVCWDRRREAVVDEAGVLAKFGVRPGSIPDWLALVGDAADGYPGIHGWGAKSTSAVLLQYRHLEAIPRDPHKWKVASISAGRAATLAEALSSRQEEALLYRRLATLRTDAPISAKLADLEWRGAHPRLRDLCHELGDDKLPARIARWLPA